MSGLRLSEKEFSALPGGGESRILYEMPLALNIAIDNINRTRRNKYNAQRCEYANMKFDSKAEMRRYGELCLMRMAGEIRDVEHHPRFTLQDGGRAELIRYTADFMYIRCRDDQIVVEDVKGGRATLTTAFVIRWKLVKRLHPEIEFALVGT